MPAVPCTSTGVAITNPLVLYRALLATKRIDPDPAQHRLALRLAKLYDQLKDYEPIVEYNHRLSQISKALGSNPARAGAGVSNDATTPRLEPRGLLASLFEQRQQSDGLALTRVLTSHEEAIRLDSPRGLMLHGEVGTGKSMLIDLFADCLPNRKKKRWHFTTFMLEVLSKLEYLRRSRQTIIPSSLGQQDDYSLLWIARDMISTSPILFLDEFQLPDRAASKIMTNLMTCFFHLGGVLIATSNRMPEELAKAAGMEFAAPAPRKSFESLRQRLGLGVTGIGGRSNAGGEFASFLEVLKARCEVWQMEGGKDYRRREAEQNINDAVNDDARDMSEHQAFEGLEGMSAGNIGLGYEQSRHTPANDKDDSATPSRTILPKQFLIIPSLTDNEASALDTFNKSLADAVLIAFPDGSPNPIPWSTSSMRVYGRSVVIPRQYAGVTRFTFPELCGSTLGPADYITLASTFHTVILTDVPVLSVLQKNEARRFITLLDALYESRCKLLITASAGPDDLFFPDSRNPATSDEETVSQDSILPETLSDIYQDATAPFRPNVSSYSDSSDPGLSTPIEPDFTHARLAGVLSDDQLEDGPPNRPHPSQSSHDKERGMGRGDSIYGLDTAESNDLDDLRQQLSRQRAGPDFSQAGIFTGEDEKFAYKRARSRLWEMCGKRWWERTNDEAEGERWWRPLAQSVRRWESGNDTLAAMAYSTSDGDEAASKVKVANAPHEEGTLGARDVDKSADDVLYKYGHNASPFRRVSESPPKFSFVHIWGNMKWGKKAGAWGQGVEGLEERKSERERMKERGEDGDDAGRGGKDDAAGKVGRK